MHQTLRQFLSVAACAAALGTGLRGQAHQTTAPDGGHGAAMQHDKMMDHMERRFDKPEEWAKNFDDPKRDAWQMPDRIIEALALQPNQSIADIGAGTGYFTTRLAKSKAAPSVVAVDIEASMVDYIKARAAKEGLKNVTAVQGSATSPNLPAPMDVIMVVDTYHHIGGRDAYFRALHKSLTPGGRLVIIDWRKGGPMGPPDHFRFPPEHIRMELGKAGYEQVAEHTFLPNQIFLVFKVKA